MRFVKPLDADLVRRLAASHDCIVTIEENAIAGGAGSAVDECLAEAGIDRLVHRIGIPDRFIEHGSREDCLVSPASMRRARNQVQRIWRPPPAAAVASRAS
jgi:1-deoxy-D-xylulose-5-phosphate synthase